MSTAHLSSYLYTKQKETVADHAVVAYFPFDDNYTDVIGGLNPLIPIQNDLLRDGKYNKSLLIYDVNGTTITTLNTPKYLIPYPMKTISMWFKFHGVKIMKGTPRTIFCIEPNSDLSIRVYQEKSDVPGITLEVKYDGAIKYKHIPSSSFNPNDGNWHMLVIETNSLPYYNLNLDPQSTTKFVTRLWLDDKRYEIETDTEKVYTGKILLGHHPDTIGTQETGNVLIDDLIIRIKEYDPDEIQSWYYSGQELYDPYDYSYSIN